MRFLPLLCLLASCSPAHTDDTDDTAVDPGCDADSDGLDALDCGGTDCDDTDPDAFPGAPERCNGVDDDCDGEALWEQDGQCLACEQAGLFADLVAQRDAASRRTWMHDAIDGVRCTYRDASDRLFTQLDKVDGFVTCVYTGERVAVGGEKPDSNVMNVEHSWPQSQGASTEPARCDLHHLFPTITAANSARGNLPLGEVSGGVVWSQGGSSASSSTFEPRDAHKGDAARAMLYFALQYDQPLTASERERYQSWHREHPPQADDVARDSTIARWQDSHNPFVVCPFAAPDLAP